MAITMMRAISAPITMSALSPDYRLLVGDMQDVFLEDFDTVVDDGAELFSDTSWGKTGKEIAMREAQFGGVNVGQPWDLESIPTAGTFSQLWDVTARVYAFIGSLSFSFGAMEHDVYKLVAKAKTTAFRASMQDLFQLVQADWFANVFDVNWYDGVPFASDGHLYAPNAQGTIALGTTGSNYSNIITGPPTYGNILKGCVQMETQRNLMGRVIPGGIRPSVIRCHDSAVEYINQELNKGMGTIPHTADNDKNTLESRNLQVKAYPYMPTKTMWWLEADGKFRQTYRYQRKHITLLDPKPTRSHGVDQDCWFEIGFYAKRPMAYIFSTGL